MGNQPLRGSRDSQLEAIVAALKLILDLHESHGTDLSRGVKSVIKSIEKQIKTKR